MVLSKAFGIAFAVTLIIIGFIVWRGFVDTKGNHLEPAGHIGKVRAQKVDENETVMVFDFSLRNDSDRLMVVRSVEAVLDEPDGSTIEGQPIAAKDLDNVFRNYPDLGEKFNEPLRARDQLAARQSVDRMAAFRFDAPDQAIAARKDVVLRIEDITGPVAELKAK